MRKIPELNTTSTADISFMLLTFFLVTSSMDSDKGLPRQLPPMPRETEEVAEAAVDRSYVMDVSLEAGDSLFCDGRVATTDIVRKKVMELAAREPLKHVVTVKSDPQTSYQAYFRLQNAIVSAYNTLRDRKARKLYGHNYAECSQEERTAVAKAVPQRISEAEPDEEGGGK